MLLLFLSLLACASCDAKQEAVARLRVAPSEAGRLHAYVTYSCTTCPRLPTTTRSGSATNVYLEWRVVGCIAAAHRGRPVTFSGTDAAAGCGGQSLSPTVRLSGESAGVTMNQGCLGTSEHRGVLVTQRDARGVRTEGGDRPSMRDLLILSSKYMRAHDTLG